MTSIKNFLDFYIKYKQKNNNAKLYLLGDGTTRKEIEEYLKLKNTKDYEFLGSTNNVIPYLEKSDIVLGVDRCILEALTMKKIAIISGYKNFKGIVNLSNIKLASKENFSGNNLKENSIDSVIEELINLNEKNILEVKTKNYEFIKNNLDIMKNIYIINKYLKIDYKNAYEVILKESKKYKKQFSVNSPIIKIIRKIKK